MRQVWHLRRFGEGMEKHHWASAVHQREERDICPWALERSVSSENKAFFPMRWVATGATKPHNGKSLKPSWPRVSDGQTVRSKTERNKTGKDNKERGQGKVAAAWAEPRCLQRGQMTSVIIICVVWWPRSAPSSPLPGAHPRLAKAIVSVCGVAVTQIRSSCLLTESESSHEKPFFPQGDTNKSLWKPMRPDPVSQSYSCPMWGMLPSLCPGA